jgi:predicted kinase
MDIKQIIKEEMEDLTKTKKLYVLVGPPSVGKSTWIKSLNNNDVIIINRDEIVEEVAEKNGLTYDEMFITPSSETSEIGDIHPKYGEVIESPPHMSWTDLAYDRLVKINGYVHHLLTTKIEQAVNSGNDIVVDMTNMNKGSRKRALKFLGDKSDEYKKIAVVFKFQGAEHIIKKVASIRAQQYKDAGKSKTIGDEVFDMMFKSYEEPTTEEGFDDIIYVDNIKQLELVIKNNKKL